MNRSVKSCRGVSLVELVIAIAVILIGSAVALVSIQSTVKNYHVVTATRTVEMQMRLARQYAIDMRRVVHLHFATPGTISSEYRNGTDLHGNYIWASLGSIDLPNDVQFDAEASLPNPGPDGFGSGTLAIDFDNHADVYFWPDGSAKDNTGANLVSGVVYVAQAGNKKSQRAVTLFGATGSARVYWLSGTQWVKQ